MEKPKTRWQRTRSAFTCLVWNAVWMVGLWHLLMPATWLWLSGGAKTTVITVSMVMLVLWFVGRMVEAHKSQKEDA